MTDRHDAALARLDSRG